MNSAKQAGGGTTPAARRITGRLAAALVIECVLLLALADGFIAWSNLDMKLLGGLLYYQTNDLEVHRPSGDPALHFELKPGASALIRGQKKVSVNSLGFRGPQRTAEKPAGVTRIVILGASNTYGAIVSDTETYPAQLERLLNGLPRGKYEVWNAGVSAYVLPQNITVARRVVREYSPDLLIFQLSNKGRRPFLSGQPLQRFFEQDPGLYLENLRYCWPRSLNFLRCWRLFRAVVLAANRLSLYKGDPGYDWNKSSALRMDDVRGFADFYAENRGKVRMAFLRWPGGYLDSELSALGLPEIRLDKKLPAGAGPEYSEIHPPAHVYAWYAREILAELFRSGLLPARPPAGPLSR